MLCVLNSVVPSYSGSPIEIVMGPSTSSSEPGLQHPNKVPVKANFKTRPSNVCISQGACSVTKLRFNGSGTLEKSPNTKGIMAPEVPTCPFPQRGYLRLFCITTHHHATSFLEPKKEFTTEETRKMSITDKSCFFFMYSLFLKLKALFHHILAHLASTSDFTCMAEGWGPLQQRGNLTHVGTANKLLFQRLGKSKGTKRASNLV